MNRDCLPMLLVAVPMLAALSGCAPVTTYRYSAFVPAVRPLPWDGQTPHKSGTISVEGSLTNTAIQPNQFPAIGDTAVLVPNWTAEGSAMVSVSPRVQVGVRAAYASYASSMQSATGTMPVPNAPPSWGVGPELRAAFPLDRHRALWLGMAGNLLSYSVPYAEWTLEGATPPGNGGNCGLSATSCDGYSLTDTRTERHFVYNLGLYPTVNVGREGEYGHVIASLSMTNGFRNDGFTNQASNGSTISSTDPIVIVGAGYGFRVDWLHASALLYYPLTNTSSPVDYGFGLQFMVGVDIDTRPSEPAERAPQPPPESPPPQPAPPPAQEAPPESI